MNKWFKEKKATFLAKVWTSVPLRAFMWGMTSGLIAAVITEIAAVKGDPLIKMSFFFLGFVLIFQANTAIFEVPVKFPEDKESLLNFYLFALGLGIISAIHIATIFFRIL